MSKDARFLPMVPAIVVLLLFLPAKQQVTFAAEYATANFVISNAPTVELAKTFGETAEKCRAELAELWLGETLPNWSAKCPIKVKVGSGLGAGGSTTFIFQNGEVFGWEMDIQGSAERIVDSVLPHEITHMIFASHFRSALPRWLDEGGATSVEHAAEQAVYRRLLLEFLDDKVRKGLPFNKMVALREYPSDPMPLYAQGFSVVEFLLAHGGHRRFVRFCEHGLTTGNWGEAIRDYYGYENLGKLQTVWTGWVAAGSVDVATFEPTAAYVLHRPADHAHDYSGNAEREPRAEHSTGPILAVAMPNPAYAARSGEPATVLPGPAPDPGVENPLSSSTVILEWSRPIRF